MKANKKALAYACAALAILACIGATRLVWGELSATPDSSEAIVTDLAVLSGLPEDIIVELYQATQSWPAVRDNIFVYKTILALVPAEMSESGAIFEIIKTCEPDKILAACEFLDKNGKDFTRLDPILSAQADGQDLGKVFAENIAAREYVVYQPASEAQVETWLAGGCLPEDILAADQIAMDKDMAIEEILNDKTDHNTWQEIAAKYGAELESDDGQAQVSLTIQTNESREKFAAADYSSLAEQAGSRAAQRKNDQKAKITKAAGVSAAQLKAYQEEGFNDYEVGNACRLAQESGTDVKTVLDYKKKGTTWEQTIKHFAGQERQAKP